MGDTLQRVPASRRGNISSTPSAAIPFYLTVDTFIPHASSSLQTGSGACGHPKASSARHGSCTCALYRGGNRVRGTGRSEWGRGRERERRWEWEREREWRRANERKTGTGTQAAKETRAVAETGTGTGAEKGTRMESEGGKMGSSGVRHTRKEAE